MIQVSYWKDEDLRKWYADKMVPELIKKTLEPDKVSPVLENLREKLKNRDEDVLRELLVEGKEYLTKKYEWVEEYVRLCDFLAYYDILVGETKKTKAYIPLRRQYLDQFRGVYLEELIRKLGISEEELTHNWKNFNQLKKEAELCFQEADQLISSVLDYDMMPQEIRYELYWKMDVQVCPYCNRQYIHTVSLKKAGTYLGDLDHVLPKSYYRLFSLSLWNLIPVCKPCNQLFKRQYNKKILSPLEEGFDENCIMEVVCHDTKAMIGLDDNFDSGWKIQKHVSGDKRERLQQNLELFRLNDVYLFHRQKIKSILQQKYLQSQTFDEKREELLKGMGLSENEKNQLYYGTSLDKSLFHKEVLGKMTYDIVKHDQI